MLTSPLARVIAPKHPLVASTLVASLVNETRPDFGAAIDKAAAKHRTAFNYYKIVDLDKDGKATFRDGDVEADTRAKAAKITAALAAEFPEWEIIERIESAEHKPPFAVSWNFARKEGK